jgi:hypothetical protein
VRSARLRERNERHLYFGALSSQHHCLENHGKQYFYLILRRTGLQFRLLEAPRWYNQSTILIRSSILTCPELRNLIYDVILANEPPLTTATNVHYDLNPAKPLAKRYPHY